MADAPAVAHQWLYVKENFIGTTETVGPIPEAELTGLVKAGKLKRDTQIASPTRTKGQWCALSNIPGLLKLLEAGEQERHDSAAAKKQAAETERDAQKAHKQAQRDEVTQKAAQISDCPNVEMINTIHDRVRGILTSNEKVDWIVVQQKLVAMTIAPDAVVITNRRLIFYRPKLLGRFDFDDYQWLDLSDAHIQQNMLGSVFTAKHTSGKIVSMDSLPKVGAQTVYRLAQEREEQARLTRLEMQRDTARAGATQINLAGVANTQSTTPAAGGVDLISRLKTLKDMADAGLITAADYEERKKQILAQV